MTPLTPLTHPIPMPAATGLDALAKAVQEFNSWRFYDCHETLEDVWLDAGGKSTDAALANFYQGIIKVAAGFHHVLRDNHRGAVLLLTDALRLLAPYHPQTLGVDVEALTEPRANASIGSNRSPRTASASSTARSSPPSSSSRRLATDDNDSIPSFDGFVSANGLRLHYLTWQQPSGGRANLPPVAARACHRLPRPPLAAGGGSTDSRLHGVRVRPSRTR